MQSRSASDSKNLAWCRGACPHARTETVMWLRTAAPTPTSGLFCDLELCRVRQFGIEIKVHPVIAGRPSRVRPRQGECAVRIPAVGDRGGFINGVIRRNIGYLLCDPHDPDLCLVAQTSPLPARINFRRVFSELVRRITHRSFPYHHGNFFWRWYRLYLWPRRNLRPFL